MAQLKEGSIIRKPTGDEVIATVKDIPLNTSELINDSGYAAQDGLDNRVRFITETQYDTLEHQIESKVHIEEM